MVTRQEAKDMREAIRQLEAFEAQQAQTKFNADLATANIWWDIIKPSIPKTRDEALTAYRFIESQLKIETDKFRLILLRQKLQLANEKYKERKRNG